MTECQSKCWITHRKEKKRNKGLIVIQHQWIDCHNFISVYTHIVGHFHIKQKKIGTYVAHFMCVNADTQFFISFILNLLLAALYYFSFVLSEPP